MTKLKKIEDGNLWFFCPGCERFHAVDDRWEFNGDYKNPTFSPSIDVKGETRCHSFVENGKIRFLSDCSHNLAGQTVELPEI